MQISANEVGSSATNLLVFASGWSIWPGSSALYGPIWYLFIAWDQSDGQDRKIDVGSLDWQQWLNFSNINMLQYP
jgi:hypothetical protein